MRRKTWLYATVIVFALVSLAAPAADAGTPHITNVTLDFYGLLVARGRVTVPDGTEACMAGRVVHIQKRGEDFRWRTVGAGDVSSSGRYRVWIFPVGGTYRTFVTKSEIAQGTCASARSRIVIVPDVCTPGYSPCLVLHNWEDYDCYGGDGNGPWFTDPGVTYRVTGNDPYGLDGDNDGYGCGQ